MMDSGIHFFVDTAPLTPIVMKALQTPAEEPPLRFFLP